MTVPFWLPIATLVLGIVLNEVAGRLREARATQGEREVWQRNHDAERTERRREDQRQTLREVRRAAYDFQRSIGVSFTAYVETYRQGGTQWDAAEEANRRREALGEPQLALEEAKSHLNVLAWAVHDEDVRDGIRALIEADALMILADSEEAAWEAVRQMMARHDELQQRVRTVLEGSW